MQPEAKLVKKLQDMFRKRGAACFKIHGGDNPFQAVGIPDLLLCYRGQFIGAEVKMPGEPLRPAQVVALGEIYKGGGIAAIIETVEQGRKLLSYCEERTSPEIPTLFDRGFICHTWGHGPKRS
jgi:hypothetical protein